MTAAATTSDGEMLDLMRRHGPMSISQLIEDTGVTATAVRQRLNRLMAEGLVDRELSRTGRGRPSYHYQLTAKARRQVGTNFADLALVLWNELRGVEDPQVRRGLLERVADAMAAMYAGRISGETVQERLESVAALLAERNLPFAVDPSDGLPVLTALECPYPVLAERDRGICAIEKMMLSKVVETNMKLTQCRLDGASCCQFAAN